MNNKDRFIKDILKKDKSPSEAPASEWSHIVRKIDDDKSFLSFANYKLVSSFAVCLLLVVVGINIIPTGSKYSDQAIAELFAESQAYFDENGSDQRVSEYFYTLE